MHPIFKITDAQRFRPFLWLFSGLTFVLLALYQLGLRTGALVVDEFGFALFVRQHYTALQILAWSGAVLVCLSLVFRVRADKRMLFVAMLTSGFLFGISHDSFWLVLATVGVFSLELWVLVQESGPEEERWSGMLMGGAWKAVCLFHLKAFMVLLLTLSLSSIIVSLLEFWLFTGQFSHYFGSDALWKGFWFLSASAMQYGLESAKDLLPIFLPLWAVVLLVSRRYPQWGAVFACMFLGVILSDAFVAPLEVSFGGEIEDIGLQSYLFAVTVVFGCFVAIVVARNLQWLLARSTIECRKHSGLIFVQAIASAPLVPFRSLFERAVSDKGPAVLWMATFTVAVLLACFASIALYPDLVDYSAKAEGLFAQIVIVFSFFTVFSFVGLVLTRFPLPWLPLVMATGAVMLFGHLGISSQIHNEEVRVLAYEYSRLNRVFGDLIYDEWLPEDRLGYEPPPEEGFSFFGKKHAVLPQLQGSPPSTPPHIIVFLSDAARRDRMGLYGHWRATTSEIDAFAKEAVVFDRHYSAGTATTVGLRALFTGKYSSRFMTEKSRVSPFFTGELPSFGYRDFFLNINGSDRNGVSAEAFERHLPASQKGKARYHFLRAGYSTSQVNKALERLSEHKREADDRNEEVAPFLLYLHTNVTHTPWKQHVDTLYWGREYKDKYDSGMQHADLAFGRLLRGLKKLGFYENAIVIFTSDHGTGLGDHGHYGGFKPYEEQIRIPLIMKMPGISPQTVRVPTSSIDIAPTLLNYLRGGVPNAFHGVSLMPLLEGSDMELDREFLYSIVAFNDAYAVIQGGEWKLYHHRGNRYRQLFNLVEDPLELKRLNSVDPERVDFLTQKLGAFLWEGRGWYANPYHYRPWPDDEADRPQ